MINIESEHLGGVDTCYYYFLYTPILAIRDMLLAHALGEVQRDASISVELQVQASHSALRCEANLSGKGWKCE